MNLNLTTFLLEIVNFLVLVWLLKRFLYKPVRDAIEARRRGVEKILADAQAERKAADVLKAQYEGRTQTWENEKRKARMQLDAEIAAERSKRLAELDADLAKQRDRKRALEERAADQRRQAAETAALARAGHFVQKLLKELSGPELERRLLDILLRQIGTIPPDELGQVRRSWHETQEPAALTTAFALDDAERKAVTQSLRAALGERNAPLEFRRDPALLAGAHLAIGSWVLGANLRDELGLFRSAANADA